MYKNASRLKLRFKTTKGLLTVEQLWNLSLTELDSLAVYLEKNYKKSDEKSFLVAKSEEDKEAKLKFDVVLDVLNTKVEESKKLKNEAERKVHNEKIMSLIKEKEDAKLKDMDIEDLKKMVK